MAAVARAGERKVDDRGRPAGQGGARARVKVVGRGRAHHLGVEVGVGVHCSGEDEEAGAVDGF